jgi:hypothetical protein
MVDGGVEFILIGGLVVAALGAPRATLDTDIVASPELDNLERLLSAGPNARFETRLGQLRVVQSPAGAPPYAELAADSIEVPLGPDLSVRVCSYEHLVAMKEASGRDQDRVDLERLREARG